MTSQEKTKLTRLLNLHKAIYVGLNTGSQWLNTFTEIDLNNMKRASSTALATLLSGYKYSADSLFGYNYPVIQPPQITITRYKLSSTHAAGNCNDSSKLIETVRPGSKVWVFLKDIVNLTDAGHFVAQEEDLTVWSNFRREDKYSDIKKCADNYVHGWKYAIQITNDFKAAQIIEA